jgi:hypothetical protein
MAWVQKRFCDLMIYERFKVHPKAQRWWMRLGSRTAGAIRGCPRDVTFPEELVWVVDAKVSAGGVILGAG